MKTTTPTLIRLMLISSPLHMKNKRKLQVCMPNCQLPSLIMYVHPCGFLSYLLRVFLNDSWQYEEKDFYNEYYDTMR